MNYKVVSNDYSISVLEGDLFPLYTLDQQMVQENLALGAPVAEQHDG